MKETMLLTVLTFLFCWVCCIKKKRRLGEVSCFYRQAWRKARRERLDWKKDHPFVHHFDRQEYQDLFDREIGAEALYRIYGSDPFRLENSIREYFVERREALGI